MDIVAGYLEVDRADDTHEIVISHPVLVPDLNGVGHIKLQPRHARHLAYVLLENATYVEAEIMGSHTGKINLTGRQNRQNKMERSYQLRLGIQHSG
jgi:hypothetical protein